MNILSTGAEGFVGKNLTEALKNIRDGKDRTHPDINIEEIYCFDVNSSERELDKYCANADFVFNFAGVTVLRILKNLCKVTAALLISFSGY